MTFVSSVDIVGVSASDISSGDSEGGTSMHPPLTEGIYYILLALYEPRHGYGIMQQVEQWSNGRVKLGAGTTYGALKNLQDKQFIETLAGEGRKKEYVITELGKEVVETEIQRLQELYKSGQIILSQYKKE